ncbi:hypothetical protein SpCBS45565_g06570 [Spizellomyces sp. 'palustris']|nr:hypothetical protein SpCBS45565_g06570 [Spizellomyces sp. 'palustris']
MLSHLVPDRDQEAYPRNKRRRSPQSAGLVPSWLDSLKNSLGKHFDKHAGLAARVQLSTLSTQTRPQTRTTRFRGFFNPPCAASRLPAAITVKLSSLLLLEYDLRSDNLVMGSEAELLFALPKTNEEYRLSGTLYCIAPPSTTVSQLPSWARGLMTNPCMWDAERRRVWTSLSPKEQKEYGSEEHFGILLLDVDSVDHLVLEEWNEVVAKERTLFKVVVPKRTWGRITGVDWEVEIVK